jgi:regulator of protease activity HflC (stomatin/prohibitin superfamily)
VTSFGQYSHTLPPGRHKFNTYSEEVQVVNLKTVAMDVSPQEVVTKDNLMVRIDAVCFYSVLDAQRALFNVDNFREALSNLCQVTLRTVLGENTLSELFQQRQKINARLQELIDESSDAWGIKVSRVELSDISVDPQMTRALAAKAEANQVAEAKLIQARAQRDAAEVLSEAAGLMSSRPASLKLQWFETLRIIATQGISQTVIVPDIMSAGEAIAVRGIQPARVPLLSGQ